MASAIGQFTENASRCHLHVYKESCHAISTKTQMKNTLLLTNSKQPSMANFY